MAAPQSTEDEIQKWLKIITEGEQSNLSAKEYCAKTKIKGKDGKLAPINTKTYSSWKKRLRDFGHDIPEPAATKGAAKRPVAKRVAAKKPAAKPASKVSTIPPNLGNRTVQPSVDVNTLTITATLPNGVMLDLKCPTKDDLDTALKTLLQTLMSL